MQNGDCILESIASTTSLLDQYDAQADLWKINFEGPFWEAVRIAHARGKTGSGWKIAIIDSGCNREIPRLKNRIRRYKNMVPGKDIDQTGHGTAVVLLISMVAPDAELDVYKVVPDVHANQQSFVDVSAAIQALELAAASDVQIINLSLGIAKEFKPDLTQLLEMVSCSHERFDLYKSSYTSESAPCSLCKAATAVGKQGKFIFAAAGNNPSTLFCPGRAEGVVAVGFLDSVRQTIGEGIGSYETAWADKPENQASLWDLSIASISGVAGTSFCSPLYAACATFVSSKQELEDYVMSSKLAETPQLLHHSISSKTTRPDDMELIGLADKAYKRALAKLPHCHSPFEYAVRLFSTEEGNVRFQELKGDQEKWNEAVAQVVIDPSTCPTCGLFADDVYTNFGLWNVNTGREIIGCELLAVTRKLAPWSDHAAANLGAAYAKLGLVTEAIDQFKDALRLRPGCSVYKFKLDELNSLQSGTSQ
jgi:hypothetical protein